MNITSTQLRKQSTLLNPTLLKAFPVCPPISLCISGTESSHMPPQPSISFAHQKYAQLQGTFNYNKTPLAPPGCCSLIYKSLQHCVAWNTKGTDGWYVGPALNNHQCHKIYTPSTMSERTAKTVDFFIHNCAVPFASPLDDATRAADSLARALQGHQPIFPFAAPGDAQYQAI